VNHVTKAIVVDGMAQFSRKASSDVPTRLKKKTILAHVSIYVFVFCCYKKHSDDYGAYPEETVIPTVSGVNLNKYLTNVPFHPFMP
jgi:hypothetical protein